MYAPPHRSLAGGYWYFLKALCTQGREPQTTMSFRYLFLFRLISTPRKCVEIFILGPSVVFSPKTLCFEHQVEFGLLLHCNFLTRWAFKCLTLNKGAWTWGSEAWWPSFDPVLFMTCSTSRSIFESRNWRESKFCEAWWPRSVPSEGYWSVTIFLCGEQLETSDKLT